MKITAGANGWSVALADREACAAVVDDVARALATETVSAGGRRLTDVLLLAFRRIEEENRTSPQRISVEVSLLFGNGTVQLVIRDNGKHIALDDLGLPVMHLPEAGFNRNVFTQPLAHRRVGARGSRTQDSRYVVLRGNAATEADLEAVIALDRAAFDARYQVAAEQDRDLYMANRENGLIVKERSTGEVVGYSMILPVREDVYQQIRAGRFVDTALTKDMVCRFDHPGEYRIYFASVVIHPRHRGVSLLMTMVDAMFEDFLALAERGIFGRTLTADVVSREDEKLAQLLGLKEVSKTDHGSSVFEVTALPPLLRETTPTSERLIGVYWEKFVKDRHSSISL